jgi:hypothetical protein
MKKGFRLLGSFVVLLAAALFVVSCGGGGGGDSTPVCTTCSNIAGTWSTLPNHETVHASNCGDGTYTEGNTYTVTQNGCSLTVVPTGSGLTFTGQICNNTLSWSGSYPDQGGTTTITSSSYTFSGNTFAGTANWTWSGSGSSCTGYTDVTATKL